MKNCDTFIHYLLNFYKTRSFSSLFLFWDYFVYKSRESDELCQMVPMIKVIKETDISFEIHKKDKSGKKCYL